ncbi:N-acetylneuraminate synthase family protein [Litorivicinus sp.]|nr:N-acetylneuraminate synthase family protein [Litorivicinus sp.]
MKPCELISNISGEAIAPYFIADVGANHDGDLQKALDLINLIADAGGHAAKFQHFSADTIVSDGGFKSLGTKMAHQSKWKKSVFQIYEDASINLEWTEALRAECKKRQIDFFTSAYSHELVDFIDPFVDVYKIGSGDITWTEILEHTAKKNKPILLATGASTLDDVHRAMSSIQKYNNQVCLMQCNTNYTGSLENFKYCNLTVLNHFKELYPGVTLGLSDHTPGHATVLGALALGATVFEKHFTDNNEQEGPDHSFAMNPNSWTEMVDRSNELWQALGDGKKRIEDNETDSVVVQRRSLHTMRDLPLGRVLDESDLVPLRPCPPDGIAPYQLSTVLGKKLLKTIKSGSPLSWTDVEH